MKRPVYFNHISVACFVVLCRPSSVKTSYYLQNIVQLIRWCIHHNETRRRNVIEVCINNKVTHLVGILKKCFLLFFELRSSFECFLYKNARDWKL
jgi:hypothetical protein